MLESLKQIWEIIKGRVITDLNLVGVAVLLWIVAHQGASALPFVALFPAVVQPIVGFVLPLVFGVVVQYAIKATRNVSAPDVTEANHIGASLEDIFIDLLQSPNVKAGLLVALKDAEKVAKPIVLGAVATELPLVEPAVEAVFNKVEQTAGFAEGAASTAGEVKEPATGSGPVASPAV